MPAPTYECAQCGDEIDPGVDDYYEKHEAPVSDQVKAKSQKFCSLKCMNTSVGFSDREVENLVQQAGYENSLRDLPPDFHEKSLEEIEQFVKSSFEDIEETDEIRAKRSKYEYDEEGEWNPIGQAQFHYEESGPMLVAQLAIQDLNTLFEEIDDIGSSMTEIVELVDFESLPSSLPEPGLRMRAERIEAGEYVDPVEPKKEDVVRAAIVTLATAAHRQYKPE